MILHEKVLQHLNAIGRETVTDAEEPVPTPTAISK
ncbi:hypothetical protein SPHS6_02681 [Sphingobium sp. S6]|nr:hypothetical protein SPHS8_01448 [Sphingobium sp. S8]CAD7339752.1 hypothetical protein SPHS6_02681 [Sphingobium sp. S6]